MFVLTHHAHDPFELDGGTTFHVVTDGFDAAFARATAAADGRGVDIAGGASTVRQSLRAGVVGELTLDIAPVLLGGGERLLDGIGTPTLVPVGTCTPPRPPTSATAWSTEAVRGRGRPTPGMSRPEPRQTSPAGHRG